jgi:hypothetical protein
MRVLMIVLLMLCWIVCWFYWTAFLPEVYVSDRIDQGPVGHYGAIPLLIPLVILFISAWFFFKRIFLTYGKALKAIIPFVLAAPIFAVLVFHVEEVLALRRGKAFLSGALDARDPHIVIMDNEAPEKAFDVRGVILPWWSIQYREGVGWFYVI